MSKNMKKMNLWIDTDMGNDDIMALAMLAQDPKIEIKAISLVNGVSRVKKGLPNLKGILEYLNLNPGLFIDSSIKQYPYKLEFPKQDINRAEELTLLEKLPIRPVQTKAKYLNELLSNLPDKSTLLALGPLTNVAKLIKEDPKLFKQKVSQIVLMGGGIKKGNVPPLRVAEYNIALDTISAKTVFQSGLPITMVGIDATSQVPCTAEFKQEISQIKPTGSEATILKEIIVNNENDFDDFYDPLAAAILLDGNLITQSFEQGIEVVTSGSELGRTVLTASGVITVVKEIDSATFYTQITNFIQGGQI